VGELLQALHQVALDNALTNAHLMLSEQDPVCRKERVATAQELNDQMGKRRRSQKDGDLNPRGDPKGDEDKDQVKGGKSQGDGGQNMEMDIVYQ
jgi:hypothetical protein